MVVGFWRLETEKVVEPVASSCSNPISLANAHSRVCLLPWKITRWFVMNTVTVSMAIGVGAPRTK